jgi:FSR family fosmidomycin resistance protein-like MFS transporter
MSISNTNYSLTSPRKASLLLVYGGSHCLVDAACAALVFGLVWQHQLAARDYFLLAIAYNVVAFALQPLCGLVCDKVKNSPAIAACGIFLTGLSIILSPLNPVVAVCCAGLGNGFFHVAGGAVSLQVAPRRAAFCGLFVAPGALGIALGAFLGSNGPVAEWPFAGLLALAAAAVMLTRAPEARVDAQPKSLDVKWPVLVGTLLLFSVLVRSLAGFGAGAPWKDDKLVLFLIVCAAFAGKGLGGIIADRFGWVAASTAALLASAPLLAFGSFHPAIVIAGMFLLQTTMPVTLAALYALLPRKPSFAFGLTCLALIMGAAPFFTHWKGLFCSAYVVFPLVVAAAAVLYYSLRLLPAGAQSPARPGGAPVASANSALAINNL